MPFVGLPLVGRPARTGDECRLCTSPVVTGTRQPRLFLRMKRIGTLGYIILGMITTSAFASTASTSTTAPAATEAAQASAPGKHKKGGKKHGSHHAHKKKTAPAAEQK